MKPSEAKVPKSSELGGECGVKIEKRDWKALVLCEVTSWNTWPIEFYYYCDNFATIVMFCLFIEF